MSNIELEDQDILIKNYDSSNSLGVPIARTRFPLRDGIQQKITLMSSVTGRFKNIYFVKGIENTINGAIADDLLNTHAGLFSVIKINGKLVEKGKENDARDKLKAEIMNELKDNYNVTPIEKNKSKRDRPDEQVLSKKVSSSSNKYEKVN